MRSLQLILTIFLAAGALLSPSSFATPTVIDRLEASVNSNLILLSDVAKFRQTMPLRAQLDPLFAGTTVASLGSKAPDLDIVQFLVNERIISQQFQVSDAEVDQEINGITAANHITRDALKNTLKEQGFSYEDYFDLIRASAAKRNLIDRDIRTKVTVSEDDIRNYFVNHYAKTSAAPMAYKVRIITVSPENFKNAAAAHATAERAEKALQAGEAFEDVAKNFSDDESAQAGGDLGTLSEDQTAPQIRDQLKKMKVGQISSILGSPKTKYFILKLVDISSTENARYEKMKEEIRNQLAAGEYQHQISLWIDRQRQSAFIHIVGESSVAGLPKAPSGS